MASAHVGGMDAAAPIAKSASGELSVEPIGLEESRVGWQGLAARAGDPFATWEWASSWWKRFGEGRELMLLTCRRDGAMIGLLPLVRERRGPLRIVRLLGAGPGDHLQPVAAPGDRPVVGRMLGDQLRAGALRCDLLLAERLPAEWARFVGGQVLHREVSPVLATEADTWEEYLESKSANFRGQLRAKERRLAREHVLRYRLADAASLDADLQTLFALHRARWGDAGSGTLPGSWADFHSAFAHTALERGWLRLWTMELDGRPVASWYGFRYGGADWYYQSGRDPSLERKSVGLVLLAHTIRDAIENGIKEYQLLRGGETYKDRFATTSPVLTTAALAASPRGRLALAAGAVTLQLPKALRRRLTDRAAV